MISFHKANNTTDLQQILELQAANHPENISKKELIEQGFVTVRHNLSLLQAMNKGFPHIVAKAQEKLIAYALVMLKEFKDQIPVLIPMFDQIDRLEYKGQTLATVNYFVMGQVCIAKGFRGQGVFYGLYEKMKTEMQSHFPMVITEVSMRNLRSLKAHEKAGFETILEYTSTDGEQWIIMSWDWRL